MISFFMESDSFEFFFSLFHPFFDHSFPFARFILSILRKNSQRVDNLEEGKWSLFLWNQIVLSNFSFRYSIHFFPFARFILSTLRKNSRRVDNLEERKWCRLGLFFIEYQILSNSFFFSSPTFFRFGGRSFPFARFTLSTSRKNSRSRLSTHVDSLKGGKWRRLTIKSRRCVI